MGLKVIGVCMIDDSIFYGRSIIEQMIEEAINAGVAYLYIDGDVLHVFFDRRVVFADDGTEGKATANHVACDILNKIIIDNKFRLGRYETVRFIESPPRPKIEIKPKPKPNKPWYRQGDKW